MGTAYSSSMFGIDDPNDPIAPKKPALTTVPPVPGALPQPAPGVSTVPPVAGATPQPAPGVDMTSMPINQPAPTPAPAPQLDTTPDAGAKLSGSQRYVDEATGAVRSMFGLWNDEQFGRDTSAMEQQLRNRGIRPGDPAYNTELQRLRETQGKLRESSNLQAVLHGGEEAQRYLDMDNTAETSNLNRQLGVANNTRADTEQRRDAQRYNNDQSAGIIGQGAQLLDKFSDGGLLGLADRGIDAISGGVNRLTGGATTGLLTKGAGLLGLGGAPALGSAALATELGAATTAAAPGLTAAMAGTTAAGAGGTTAAAAAAPVATTGGGVMAGVMAAAPYVAAAIAAAMVLDKNLPQSSPLNKYDVNAGGWSKPENFAGTQFQPQELNAFFGPALQQFAQSGDFKAALSAIPQPRNEREKILLEKGILHLFSGTGNPARQIAKAKNFGSGPWTASSKDKKALKKELGIK